VYDEFLSKSYTEIAEWFIYDVLGDLKSARGDSVSDYFDYKSFARDLGYDGYDIFDGYVFRSF
jgi:antirestriction protein